MSRHPFDLLIELEPHEIHLDCAALHLARDVYPHISVPAYLAQLDALADEVAALAPGLSAPLRYQALAEVLVDRHGFRGSTDDYYDPQNSYLNRVLDRHVGIPISLAIVWIEVARRLKWPIAGAALPSHFLVRVDDPDRFIVVDVFNGGCTLSLEDCAKLLEQNLEGKVPFDPQMLEPVGTRAILARSLANLRAVYMVNQDWNRLACVLRRLIALEPTNGNHLQELAALHFQLGDMRGAYAHLAASLPRVAESDRADVEQRMERLAKTIASLN
jgi:regulator of sirC expression with transglutaminase-like and TPR domain